MIRNAPSIHPMYQSGWAAVDTADGENGPYSHTGLICARPPSRASTPATIPNSPTLFAVYVGHSFEPTTLRSLRPGPANCVCFWRHTMARCTTSRPAMAAGTSKTWMTKRRDKMSSRGELAAEEQERGPRADDRDRQGDGVGDPQSRARQEIVGQRVPGEAVEDGEDQEGDAHDPVDLTGPAERAGEEDATQMGDDRRHEHERRPVVHLAHDETGAHVEAQADRRLVRLRHLHAVQRRVAAVVHDGLVARDEEELRYTPVSTRITKQYIAISPSMNDQWSGNTLSSDERGEARRPETVVEPAEDAVDHHRCTTGRCARARSARSIDASQLANERGGADDQRRAAEPPHDARRRPAGRAARAHRSGTWRTRACGRASSRIPSAVAGSVAAKTASTPSPRRERRLAPSAIHQNSTAVPTNVTCSSTCTTGWRTAAS